MVFRQTGGVNGGRNSDHIVSIGARGGVGGSRHHYHRRSKAQSSRKISIGFCILTLSLVLSASAFFYFSLQSRGGEIDIHPDQDDVTSNDTFFLPNVPRLQKQNPNELKFGQGSTAHGRDSSEWEDKDDRRRDGDYSEEELEVTRHVIDDKPQIPLKKSDTSSSFDKPLDHRDSLYNEDGRNELKKYAAKYEESLNSSVHGDRNWQSGDNDGRKSRLVDEADDYDDGIDLQDDQTEENDDAGHDEKDRSGTTRSHNIDTEESSRMKQPKVKKSISSEEMEDSFSNSQHGENIADSDHTSSADGRSVKKSSPGKRSSHPKPKPKPKRRKFSGSCEMKIANSTGSLVEPLENKKFARISLQYTKTEERPAGDENWEPRFAGHQNLTEREGSFIAHDQKINCGFVKGPKGSPSTGFDLAEDDAKYISSCHIAVISCIFGNSDRLRSPAGNAISRLSRKNVCFVMFVDELTVQTLSSEGHMPDSMGYLGFWKVVVVKNLPYADMRRVGKIPKLLPHRLFPSARYSIWLDSKLRLQLDPLLILEYFLWRKGHEYAISNHYDRHCLWEEVAQNKRLNKYNHTVIDEQFAFYQADGMKRFNASDPNKLLPSNVPEGSFIVRAHTPMSNLFSCLWFNEVERFTPRDQLSFGYTYDKLRKMNPEKPFYLNMFKDCERRKIAKLFRHRSEENRSILRQQTE